jgi:hypothetical protein
MLVLLAVAAAVLVGLTSPFGGAAPARAEWNECNNHVVSLDPVPGMASVVRASTDTSSGGEVGACVMTLGGCAPLAGCFITGGNVTGDLVSSPPGFTGVLVRPGACWDAYPYEEGCVNGGTTGAAVSTSGRAYVCVNQLVCQFVG